MSHEDLIAVELSDDERSMLRSGLLEWHGPARCTDAMAVALGFSDCEELHGETLRLRDDLAANVPLSRQDWQRVLMSTEVVFASDVVGSGVDWPITTGLSDEESIRLLRGLQRKLPRWRPSWQFSTEDGSVVIQDQDRP